MSGHWVRPLRDLPIRRKLMLGSLIASAAALLLATTALLVYESVTFRTTLARKVSTQAALVGANGASAIAFDDRESATKTLAALQADPHVIGAAIYKGGHPFATYVRRDVLDVPRVLNETPAPGNFYRFGDGRLEVVEPIVVDREAIGSVRIVSDLGERTARLRSYFGIVGLTFLISIALALIVSGQLQRTISGPILHLVERARVVSEQKNYAIRATPSGADELGLLIRTFNEMLEQIEARDSALEKARDDAQLANRAKDEFLAVVSHELRTPLTPIISWIHLLRAGRLNPDATARALEVIERNARSQAQLIDDLLDVSRIIAGKVRLDIQQVDLRPVVEAAVDAIRPTADAKDIRLQMVIDPRAGIVSGDPQRLQQVCWNLLSNAVKFTPKGGRVQVNLQRIDSNVEVVVSDSGQGLSSEFLPHVFDRFRQADSSSTRSHGGLGLGLAIVRHIVELHGGQVTASSAGEGQGATFAVSFPTSLLRATAAPAVERVHPTSPTAVPFAPSPVLRGLRVLVVDDEPDTLETLRAVLEECGAEVTTSGTAPDALVNVQAWKPDLLISDIGMPGEDGYALIRNVRALSAENGGKTLALALTAYARTEDRVRALSAGFQVHVTKPIEPAELVAVVASLARWSGGQASPA